MAAFSIYQLFLQFIQKIVLQNVLYKFLRIFLQSFGFWMQNLLVFGDSCLELICNVIVIDLVVCENACIAMNFCVTQLVGGK